MLYCITSENSISGSCVGLFDNNLPFCLGWLYLYIQLRKIDKQLDITLEVNLVYDYLSIVWNIYQNTEVLALMVAITKEPKKG